MELMGERGTTCCFTGHRPEKLPWRDDESRPDCQALKTRLAQALEELYAQGARHFICGMAQGCDLYFAEAVLRLRQERPDVTLEAALPCPTQTRSWPEKERQRYRAILERCDLETLVQQHYDRGCMLRRNRYMVERSAMLLAVYNGSSGGTRYTISYALDCGLKVVTLEP